LSACDARGRDGGIREELAAGVTARARRADRQVESAAWTARDWCETKDGGLHRIGGIRAGRIRLASPSGRFSLGSEGVTYFGIFIDHPPIPTSSLLKQPERKPGAIHQPHFTVDCRVFKER
jgi:hypothetical protein